MSSEGIRGSRKQVTSNKLPSPFSWGRVQVLSSLWDSRAVDNLPTWRTLFLFLLVGMRIKISWTWRYEILAPTSESLLLGSHRKFNLWIYFCHEFLVCELSHCDWPSSLSIFQGLTLTMAVLSFGTPGGLSDIFSQHLLGILEFSHLVSFQGQRLVWCSLGACADWKIDPDMGIWLKPATPRSKLKSAFSGPCWVKSVTLSSSLCPSRYGANILKKIPKGLLGKMDPEP